MLSRTQKAHLVEEIGDRLKKAKTVVLTDFKGLKVEEINELRRNLRKEGVEYKVVKNSVICLAGKDTPLEQIKDEICGPNALAISYGDPATLAKVLIQFREKNDRFKLKTGFSEGKILTLEEIETLAKLPSREVLVAQLLGTMSSPPRQLVNLLYNIIGKFLYLLEAIKKEKENREV